MVMVVLQSALMYFVKFGVKCGVKLFIINKYNNMMKAMDQ